MDGIILAGGEGTRMRPLTLTRPKPLLPLQNRPILEWSLMSLRGIVERVLVVAHYLKAQIAEFMARQSLFADYALVEQLPRPLGTGHALQCCRDFLRSDDFLVINGDDLFSWSALSELSREGYGILSARRRDYERYGVIVRNAAGDFHAIDEKPPRGRYAAPAPCSIGAYKFRADVFDYRLEKTARGEYEISDYMTAAARDHAVAVVDSPFWLPIGDPAALEAAQTVDVARWIPTP
ncbi:MAG: nucleotidyltransferase family protein [Anaerolineae bacterium]|nr:nucleotidyltransferase family protein [Anaerolineae bacterium]